MAGRRRRSSPLEDFLELVAMMPWWAGVALALVAYLLLHRFAQQPVQVSDFKAGAVAKYLVCDLQPGRWTVRGPSRADATVTPEGKCLYFTARPGAYELKLAAGAPRN